MLSFLSTPVVFTAFLGLVCSVTASNDAGDLHRLIQSRQARIVPRSPLRVRELAAAATLSNFQQMETDLAPHTSAILDLCSQLPTASAAKKLSIGAQLHKHVSQCGQIVASCGGGGGHSSPPSHPQPSGSPTSGGGSGGSSSCSAAAGVYSACVESIQSCGSALSQVLQHVPGYASSIAASFSEIDGELASVLEGSEQSVTGLTAKVQTYTKAIRSNASTRSDKCGLTTLYSLFH